MSKHTGETRVEPGHLPRQRPERGGRAVIFPSEELEHEVLPARRARQGRLV